MKWLICVLPVLLTMACASVKDAPIAVDDEFGARSDRVQLDTPHWRIKDSVYNKSLFEYKVADSDVSWQTTESDYRYIRGEKPNILEWLIFDERALSSFRNWEINKYQKFAFNLNDASGRAARSKCKIMSQNFANERYSEKNGTQMGAEHRAQTFLSCHINSRGINTYLNLLRDNKGFVDIKTDGSPQALQFDLIHSKAVVLHKRKGTETKTLPPWASRLAGIAMHSNGKQIAQLSLSEDPELWLARDIDDSNRALISALSYSLTMFNWIDGEWKDN